MSGCTHVDECGWEYTRTAQSAPRQPITAVIAERRVLSTHVEIYPRSPKTDVTALMPCQCAVTHSSFHVCRCIRVASLTPSLWSSRIILTPENHLLNCPSKSRLARRPCPPLYRVTRQRCYQMGAHLYLSGANRPFPHSWTKMPGCCSSHHHSSSFLHRIFASNCSTVWMSQNVYRF